MSTVQTKETVIALLGQPNSGKSTLFNGLTGLRQHVGNWPGKTVEQKEGYFTRGGVKYTVADLPGTYSRRQGRCGGDSGRRLPVGTEPFHAGGLCRH